MLYDVYLLSRPVYKTLLEATSVAAQINVVKQQIQNANVGASHIDKPVYRIFKESALGRFFHRVAMSVYIYVPFSCNFFCVEELVWIVTRQRTGVERRPRVEP